MTRCFLSLIVASALALAACGGNPEIPKATASTQADMSQVQALVEKADKDFATIDRADQIAGVIAQYDEIIKRVPDHKHALENLAIMQFYLAEYAIPKSAPDQRMAAYLRGRDLGLRALACNAKFREAYERDGDITKTIGLLGKDDAPGLQWAGVNWAKWGELHGIIRAAMDIPKVKAIMDRLNEVAPEYFWHSADRFFIGYWVAIPGFAGRDLKKSQAAFERAIKAAPELLDNYVVYAQYYAKESENRKLWEELLNKVLNAPPDPPDFAFKLANPMSKQDAKELLAKTKEYFE